MHITEDDIHKLEKLSNIKVDNVSKMIEDLEGVISFMDNINNFNIDIQKETQNNKDIYREDNINQNNVFQNLNRENIEENCFVVPQIIEQ